ncbi:MAG: hypothetical protein ACI9UA_003119 [Pseudoalteromonas tetraodonis]|jgi:hypothetical protein
MIFKRKLRVVLVLFALMIAIPIGIIINEKVSGDRRLEKARAAYIADGGSFDPSSRLASPVPDEENFAAIPALIGITKKDADGEAIRAELGKLAFTDLSDPWPLKKANRKDKRQPHQPRRPIDLAPVQEFFVKNGLLLAPPDPSTLAKSLSDAYESTHGAKLTEIRAARNRASAVFLPLSSEVNQPGARLIDETKPELQTGLEIAKGFKIHGLLALRSGKQEIALADIETMQKLAHCVDNDGKSLLSHLVSIAIHRMALDLVWEGMKSRSWSAPQLERLQACLDTRSLRTNLADAFHAETLIVDELMENLSHNLYPSNETHRLLSPWIGHNRAHLIELHHQAIIIPLMTSNGYAQAKVKSEAMLRDLTETWRFNPRTLFTKVCAPAVISTAVNTTSTTDAELAQAAAACALERYYLSSQSYPDKLEDLVPDFAEAIPVDPINSNPLHYQKTADGRYQLHSIGLDAIDHYGGGGDVTWNYQEALPLPPKRERKSRRRRGKP